jgi:hypothetical protein
MTRPLVEMTQIVQSKLVNRTPTRCAICDHFIGPFRGLPVILDAKTQIIEFVHSGCCVHEGTQT